MVIEGFRGGEDEEWKLRAATVSGCWSPPLSPPALTRWPSASVGILQVNIIATALAIGCATLMMSTLGIMVGRFIGPLGKRAEILGGIVLIGIGFKFSGAISPANLRRRAASSES